MIKVAMVLPSFRDKGPVIVARQIAHELREVVDFYFISLRRNTDEDLKRIQNTGAYTFEMDFVYRKPLTTVRSLNSILEKIQPDIVHVNCFFPLLFVNKNRWKTVCTVHSITKDDLADTYGKIPGFLFSWLFHSCLHKMDRIICVSKAVADSLPLKSNRVDVIHNGIIPWKMKKLKEEEARLRLISVSNLIPLKAVDRLLKILHEYINKYDNSVELIIIGDGPEREKLKELTFELGLEEYVDFTGLIPREQVFKKLAQSDIFLFASKSEGFGQVIAEAMMMNLPSVVPDIPAMREIIDSGVNGIIAKDDDSYVEAISYLSDRENAESLGRAAGKKYSECFSSRVMAGKYERIYKNVKKEIKCFQF